MTVRTGRVDSAAGSIVYLNGGNPLATHGGKVYVSGVALHYYARLLYHALADRGRILVRVSGTEPLVRVMLEGENLEEIQNLAEEAAQVVRERLA